VSPLLGRPVHHPAGWWMGMSLTARGTMPRLDGDRHASSPTPSIASLLAPLP
jgi:hypothetical protein